MKREYSLKSEKLIERICRNVEREDFVLDMEKAEEAILKTYDLFDLPRPNKVIWVKDIFDENFVRSVRSVRSAWSTRSTRSAWSAWSARSAWSAWSTWSTWSTRRCALDCDFDWFVIEFEYCQNPDKDRLPNEHDRKYLEYSELLIQAKEYGAGYQVEWEDILYIAPTPLVKIDSQNRFHSEDSPAIRWKEGKEFYFYHGISVDKEWITNPEKLTKKDWSNESNLEKRRIIQELMGDRFPKKVGAKLIAKPSQEFKEKHNLLGLYEVELPNDPEKIARYVKVKDHSSKREYFLRVKPTISDADEALAFTFGMTKEEYAPIQEA